MKWVKGNPDAVGWYAVTLCWDTNEGFFPDACHWNGQSWMVNWPIAMRSPFLFNGYADARAWAYLNDMEDVP